MPGSSTLCASSQVVARSNKQPRAVVPGPAQHVEPPGQPEAGGRVLLQVTEPVVLADGQGMAPALPAVAVGIQAGRRALAELTRHGRDHRGWRLGRIVEKGAEEARCPELNSETEPVMGAAHPSHQLAIGGVEVEVPGELLRVGIAGVAAVTRTLVVRQETGWHGVRNSRLLRQSGRGPKIRRLQAAKLPCGIGQLCDKFRTPAEART